MSKTIRFTKHDGENIFKSEEEGREFTAIRRKVEGVGGKGGKEYGKNKAITLYRASPQGGKLVERGTSTNALKRKDLAKRG